MTQCQAGSPCLARRRGVGKAGTTTSNVEQTTPLIKSKAIESVAHLDTTAGHGGPKSEIRNPKPETNSNAQWSKAQNRQQGSGLGHSLLGAWGLFRASSFGFRVSALWMAVVPRCARRHLTLDTARLLAHTLTSELTTLCV